MIETQKFIALSRRVSWWLCGVILCSVGGNSFPAYAEDLRKVDFNFHIRSILSDRCYACHGPDKENRQAELRLDTAEGAFVPSQSGEVDAVIQPGDPEASELYRRISSDDEFERMPPPESHLSLSPEEIDLIRRWIQQGAEWKEHWSFLPVQSVRPPAIKDSRWARNEIDQFVGARLEQEGLPPAEEASRARLVRRLYLDLTGLPPSVEQIDEFLADDSPNAYENLVDELLDSPYFGERMAVDWLDVARYADTFGYQSDVYRDVWPWRDWVVKAFNENLPYDTFITWQLAGDLLPAATDEQVLATAFNRLHRQTNEGGSIDEEFRVEYVLDRTDTFGVAFLGMSVGCARCHDHKFDPLSQKEYYQLSAFFDNIDESGLYSHFTNATPTPTLLRVSPEQREDLDWLNLEVSTAETELLKVAEQEKPAFAKWLSSGPHVPQLEGLIGDFPFDSESDDKTPNLADDDLPAELFESPKLVEGKVGSALKLSGENGMRTDVGGEFTRHDPWTLSFWMKTPDRKERAVVLHRSRAWSDAGSRGYEVLVEEGRLNASLIHFWPGNAISVRTQAEIPTNQWLHVAVTYDGSSHAEGIRLYLNGEQAACETIRDKLTKTILYEPGSLGLAAVKQVNPHMLTVGQRFRDRGFKGGLVDELKVFDRQLTDDDVAQLYDGTSMPELFSRPAEDLTSQEKDRLLEHFLHHHDKTYMTALEVLRTLRRQRDALLDSIDEIMVMREMDTPRPTYLLERGNYEARREEVFPETPQSLGTMSPDLPRNRLGLARWLTDPEHPLTSRVAVNRFWQLLFGRGLVATQEDFGSQGQLPSHPDLLDWLAREFMDSGWDVKALVKLIVTSATYRQDSACSPELRAADPDNILLARGPSYRLSAEMIRDAALTSCGLLVAEMGGPPVKPYQPPGLWKEKGTEVYKRDPGEGSHRRSLYTIWKRSSPPPAMMTLDAAARDTCIVRRQTTATPLQALVLLNDPQYVEAARGLAAAVLSHDSTSDSSRIEYLFRALTSCTPTKSQLEILQQLLSDQRNFFKRNPEAIDEFLKVGDFQADSESNGTELAAMSVVVQAVMNLDDFVMKR